MNSYIKNVPKGIEVEELLASSGAKDIWLAEQLVKDENQIYVIPVTYELTGTLDEGALQKAIHLTLERSEAFRTSFLGLEGGVVQRIFPSLKPEVDILDLVNDSIDLSKQEALDLSLSHCQRFFSKPFNLNEPGLIRFLLIKLSSTHYVFHFSIHHLICDNDSIGIILDEIKSHYNGIIANHHEAFLSYESSLECADFSSWQLDVLESGELSESEAYWQESLKNTEGTLSLRIGEVSATESEQGSVLKNKLSLAKIKNIESYCEEKSLTPAILHFAIFSALLYRLTGKSEIVIGVPASLREDEALEKTVGYFINVLPVKLSFTKETQFKDLLVQVSDQLYSALENKQVPYSKIVSNLSKDSGLKPSPLYDVMYNYYSGQEHWSLDGLESKQHELKLRGAKFPLTLFVIDNVDNLELWFEFQNSHIDTAYSKVLSRGYMTMLDTLLDKECSVISTVNLLSEDEYQHQVIDFNNTSQNQTSDFYNNFLQNVINNPNATAIESVSKDVNTKLTYAELYLLHIDTAKELKQSLVGKQVSQPRIAIYHNNSIDTIATILACLSESVIWIPIDHKAPVKRLKNIVEDAKPFIIYTAKNNLEATREAVLDSKALVLPIEKNFNYDIAINFIDSVKVHFKEFNEKLNSGIESYLLYTSGTSGIPKGVQVFRSGLNNYLNWAASKYYDSDKPSTYLYGVPVLTSIGFDATITSLLLPLNVGGYTIVFEEEPQEAFPSDLLLSYDKPFALIKTTPSQLEHLALSKQQGDYLDVNSIVVGGEQLTKKHLEFANMLSSKSTVYNEYGPTETVVGCCVEIIELGFEENTQVKHNTIVPIGHPIANTQMYILNESMQHQPQGVVGEIYIGGAGVAKGYWERNSLTDSSFVPHSFESKEASRFLYKTGDLGMFTSENKLICLGRIDNQVKLRGYRIELEEVEAQIKAVPGVVQSVVLLKKTHYDQLISFIVVDSKFSKQEKDILDSIKEHLAEVLPEYMIPKHFICIENLPYTINHKVDSEALLSRTNTDVEQIENCEVQHSCRVTSQVIDCFNSVLGSTKAHIKTNFFESGGDSLLAVRLIAMINHKLNVTLQLSAFYRDATVQTIVKLILSEKESVIALDEESNDISQQSSSIESKILEYISDILDRRDFNILTNFFELGGNSLLAVRLIAKINHEFSVNVKLLDFHRNATAENLVNLVAYEYGANERNNSDKDNQVTKYPSNKATDVQQIMYRLIKEGKEQKDDLANKSRVVDNCTYLYGELNKDLLCKAIVDEFSQHESLSISFSETTEGVVFNRSPFTSNIETLDLTEEFMQFGWETPITCNHILNEMSQWLSLKTHFIFAIGNCPLYKVVIIKLSENEHCLLLKIHHIIIDGGSLSILVNNVSVRYQQYLAKELGNKSLVVDKFINPKKNFSDYINWYHTALESKPSKRNYAYWQKKFEGYQGPGILKADFNPEESSLVGGGITFDIDKFLNKKLNLLCNELGITMYALMHSIYYLALSRKFGFNDFAIGVAVAGRDLYEFSDTVGALTQAIAIRTQLNENESFRDFALKVSNNLIEALDHQFFDISQLTREILSKVNTKEKELFNVTCVMDSSTNKGLSLPGINTRQFSMFDGTCRRLLNFFADERNEMIQGYLVYQSDLLKRSTVESLAKSIVEICEEVTSDLLAND